MLKRFGYCFGRYRGEDHCLLLIVNLLSRLRVDFDDYDKFHIVD